MILHWVDTNGTGQWSQSAGRTAKQCRGRWRNHLDLHLKRIGTDGLIVETTQKVGTKWEDG
jgi:hypothetical protein